MRFGADSILAQVHVLHNLPSQTFSALFSGACYLGQAPLISFSCAMQNSLAPSQCPSGFLATPHTLNLNPKLWVIQNQSPDPECTGRVCSCSHSLLIQKNEAERLGTPAEARLLDFLSLISSSSLEALQWTFASALWECDGGHPVTHTAALLAEQTQLVQSRIFPWVCTGALK